MKKVLILGCTGSIGSSSIDLVRRLKDRFSVVGLQAYKNKEKLFSLSEEFHCKTTLGIEEGNDGIARLLDETKPDIVVNGIAGAAGLIPSKLVLERGIDLALANKETVVMAWPLIKSLAEHTGSRIIPVDSEHSAIFNLINQCGIKNIDEIVITASGGPFKTLSREELQKVTVEDALKHPTWNMGKKITVDSASLANKGLEVIEAVRLFNMDVSKVKVVVHPESLIHSLVRTKDGILYAQISEPDMRHPILGALSYPEQIPLADSGMKRFTLGSIFGNPSETGNDEIRAASMTFMEPRWDDFPLLKCAYNAAALGKMYTIAFNAADEIAANAFIERKIGFLDIAEIVQKTLNLDWSEPVSSFEDVFEADKRARADAEKILRGLK